MNMNPIWWRMDSFLAVKKSLLLLVLIRFTFPLPFNQYPSNGIEISRLSNHVLAKYLKEFDKLDVNIAGIKQEAASQEVCFN